MNDYSSYKISSVKALGNYRLQVTFLDGNSYPIDLEPTLYGEIFEPLKDKSYFSLVKVDYGTICWPNGADIAPDTLRLWCEAGRVLSETDTELQFEALFLKPNRLFAVVPQ